MEEEEHEVYGGEIPDEGEMEGDMDSHAADVDMSAADDDAVKELDEMKKRLKEMEEEAAALREMQAKVEKEMGAVQDPATAAASQANKEEADARSVFVGNCGCGYFPILETWFDLMPRYDRRVIFTPQVLCILALDGFTVFYGWAKVILSEIDGKPVSLWNGKLNVFLRLLREKWQVDYACTPEEVQQHFQSCGTVNRVTILTDKFGQPKGFAYVEFLETEAVQEALVLNESELHGRQLKVLPKRTNVPGMKQFRPRRFNSYTGGFRFRRPYVPPYFYSPYGYGKAPRFRRSMRYMPYY
uniref:RRM domain-containing protein n=1 Tax=Quercus lobata TaxID=97700 RepID=A0A7N2R732_QUELO